ncbi:gluconate dehydrogenase [Thalassotalea insulae]|uniref:Gluconate dehydrogenase n=1 Tax=Thalassotalea insulae TaxID=2056778 RepID=A0ABQ6GPC8_9GAMM|nr:GMC family oxidoreductase [Thalassotalea insulae]GLX77741.1 gluconate dehydrogenase [Thalassotalea insulae]
MSDIQKYDAIVVGAGAMGAVFAHELTEAGMTVLCIEKGPFYKDHEKEFIENELETFRFIWDYTGYKITGDAFDGGPNLGTQVGGGTLSWTAAAFRMFKHDFRFASKFGCPEGANTADWPINKRMLQPFYNKAEEQMGVSGEATVWDEQGTPLPPNPPMPIYPSSRQLQQGFANLGLRSHAGRVATNSQAYNGRSGCVNCGYCRSGCRTDAKYQADEVLIKPALRTGLLTLETHSVVTKVETNNSGRRATGISYANLNTGLTSQAEADFIILANNPFEIPRLLLSSVSDKHPNGIGNKYDQIGRNFYSHATCIGMGITPYELNTYVGHSMANVMSLDTCVNTERDDYIGGFTLLSLNGSGAGSLAAFPLHKLNGLALKEEMADYNKSMVAIAFIEGMPVESNRITVDWNNLDDLGMPQPHIHYEWHQNDRNAFAHATDKLNELMYAAGSTRTYTSELFESHPMGTMRMGWNPRKSATDRFGRVHGVKNIYISGGCLFPTGSSVNPTLTMHALALRSSKKIIKKWHRKQGDYHG